MPRLFSCCAVSFLIAMTLIAGGCGSSTPPPISVSLSPSSPQAIDQSQTVAIRAAVMNDSSQGVSWSLTGAGSLSNQTSLSVTYNAPANPTGAQQATVTATSQADQTKTASVQITVNPFPNIPFQTLATGSVGVPYSQMVTLNGGTPPFQWSVYDGPIETGWEVGGSVPDGLVMNPSTGTISGTPTGGGTWYFEDTVTDATGATAVNGFLSIKINSSAPPANPVPFLNQPLVPTAVSPGIPGFTLKVSGTGFVNGATIDWNGQALASTFVDTEHLSATVPSANLATAATASVTVVNPGPGGGPSNAVYFQVQTPQPTATFVNAPNSPIPIPESVQVAVADFNEDGKADLAIAANVRVYVMLGNGDGTFAAASGSPLSIPSPPYDDFGSPYTWPVVIGDFNHSGHQGFAVGLTQNEAAAILFGKGDGTFTYSSTLANTAGQPTVSLTSADFNGDGNLDLIALNNVNGLSPAVLLGYGNGAFNAVQQILEVIGGSSAAGDFNGDGKLDLVIDGRYILLGNGNGTFTEQTSSANGSFVTVGDFNGDGNLDLAVCNSTGNSVTILLGDGTGNFATASGSPIAVGSEPSAIITGDFNSDGKLDLAVANLSDNTVTLLLGNGDGTFAPASGSPYAVGNTPIGLAAADFNADGKLDLAVVNLTDGTVSILLQQ